MVELGEDEERFERFMIPLRGITYLLFVWGGGGNFNLNWARMKRDI